MLTWQAVLVVVVALGVGAAVPALVELALALRSMRRAAERSERTFEAVTTATERLDRIVARVEKENRIESFLGAMDMLSRNVQKLGEMARGASAVGAAVGPAVVAAVRAWRSASTDGHAGTANEAEDAASDANQDKGVGT
jgi:hypothetical protein